MDKKLTRTAYIDTIAGMTLEQLYHDPDIKPVIEPYLRRYIKRHGFKKITEAFEGIGWIRHTTLGALDYDMYYNMGGGIVFEGWHEMINELIRIGPE